MLIYNIAMEKATGIEAKHISKRFGNIVALDDVSFSIPKGAVFGLLGPNGAGKTTAVRLLNGLIEPTNFEEITILGFDIKKDVQSIRQRAGVLTDTNLYERLSALDNLMLFGALYGLSNTGSKTRANRLLEHFGLSDRAGSKVETFSKGMKQKLSIARALISDPELVYLDEPTAGLDPEASYELLQYIKEVSSDSSKTFFITSHRLEEMESICDMVAILTRGKIMASGSPQELARSVFKDYWVTVKFDDAHRIDTASVKQNLQSVLEIERSSGEIKIKLDNRKAIPELIRYLSKLNVDIYGISEDVPTLQDAYLAIVKEKQQ